MSQVAVSQVQDSGSAKEGSRIATHVLGFRTFHSLSDVYKLRQKLAKINDRKPCVVSGDPGGINLAPHWHEYYLAGKAVDGWCSVFLVKIW